MILRFITSLRPCIIILPNIQDRDMEIFLEEVAVLIIDRKERYYRACLATVMLLVFFVAGCATTGINKGHFNLISSDEEVQMGQEFSVEIEKEYPVYKNAEVTAYVQSVGDRIARVCDRNDIAYHFAVIEKEEINAFALPGGYIYIYTGLMEILDDEAFQEMLLAEHGGMGRVWICVFDGDDGAGGDESCDVVDVSVGIVAGDSAF